MRGPEKVAARGQKMFRVEAVRKLARGRGRVKKVAPYGASEENPAGWKTKSGLTTESHRRDWCFSFASPLFSEEPTFLSE